MSSAQFRSPFHLNELNIMSPQNIPRMFKCLLSKSTNFRNFDVDQTCQFRVHVLRNVLSVFAM